MRNRSPEAPFMLGFYSDQDYTLFMHSSAKPIAVCRLLRTKLMMQPRQPSNQALQLSAQTVLFFCMSGAISAPRELAACVALSRG